MPEWMVLALLTLCIVTIIVGLMDFSSVLTCGLLIAVIGVLGAGEYFYVQPMLDARLNAARVRSEVIHTFDLEQPHSYITKIYGKFPKTVSSWSSIESADWIFLNITDGSDICPKVFDTFEAANQAHDGMTLSELRLLAAGYRNKPVDLEVLVPRFAVEPAAIKNCPGFEYDPNTRQLMVGDKKIGYLSPVQRHIQSNH